MEAQSPSLFVTLVLKRYSHERIQTILQCSSQIDLVYRVGDILGYGYLAIALLAWTREQVPEP